MSATTTERTQVQRVPTREDFLQTLCRALVPLVEKAQNGEYGEDVRRAITGGPQQK